MKKIILSSLIIIVLVTAFVFLVNRKPKEIPNLQTNDKQQNFISEKIDDKCPEDIEVRIFNLSFNNDNSLEALAYYKQLPTEFNNFYFEESSTCKISFSKMVVLGSYAYTEDGHVLKTYEYSEFNKLDTWNNYYQDRTKKSDYMTNVFSITKTDNNIVLTELYQE